MTAEELIIEHFEGTLSPEQEGELAQVLSASPEARAMYDRYLRVDDVLAGDAVATAPSSALDERVLAAALGAIGGTIGGGSAIGWLSGKVAAVISVVAVGGLSVFLLSNNDPEPIRSGDPVPAPVQPAPAATPAPAVTVPAPAVETQVEPAAKEPATTAPSAGAPSTSRRPKSTASSDARPARTPAATKKTPGLKLPKDQKTTINNPPVIGPNKQ